MKKLYKILRKVRSYEEQMARLTDQELAHLTDEFRARLAGGETLDGILPEAFAAIWQTAVFWGCILLMCRCWEALRCTRDAWQRCIQERGRP